MGQWVQKIRQDAGVPQVEPETVALKGFVGCS